MSLAATVYNISLVSPNVEYAQALPGDPRRIRIQARSSIDILYAFATGKVGTPTPPYMTLKSGQVLDWILQRDQTLGTPTLYLARDITQGGSSSSASSGSGSNVVEIEVWA